MGRHFRDILGEDTYLRIKDHVEQALSGHEVTFEDQRSFVDGSTRWLSEFYVPEFDSYGSVIGLFVLIKDISSRKLAEVTARSNHERLSVLHEIDKAINSNLDLDEVLAVTVHQISNIIRCDTLSIQEKKNDELEIAACQGFEQPENVIGLRFPLDPKFPNFRVIKDRTPVTFDDVTTSFPHFSSSIGAIRLRRYPILVGSAAKARK